MFLPHEITSIIKTVQAGGQVKGGRKWDAHKGTMTNSKSFQLHFLYTRQDLPITVGYCPSPPQESVFVVWIFLKYDFKVESEQE